MLQCFYPHRLTHFADLGKIFIIVCWLILLVTDESVQDFYSSRQSWKKIDPSAGVEIERVRSLVTELRENHNFPSDSDKTCDQKRYNGHLVEHYAQLERYIEAFFGALRNKKIKKTSGLHLRDRLVTDVFEIRRGKATNYPPFLST